MLLTTEAFGLRLGIEVEDGDLLDGMLPWAPDAWRPAGNGAPALDRLYRVGRAARGSVGALDGISIAAGTEELGRAGDVDSAIDVLESDLHHFIAAHSRTYLFVHAGVAGLAGRLILLPGRSLAGKSTLVHALCECGAEYYSDDYAVLDRDGWVYPFPRHLRLRQSERGGRHRVDPASHDWLGSGAPSRIALVAVLTYRPGAVLGVETLTQGQGALALLDNAVAARTRPFELLEAVSNALEGARVVRGIRGEAGETAVALLRCLAE